jgi:hypothetical protein
LTFFWNNFIMRHTIYAPCIARHFWGNCTTVQNSQIRSGLRLQNSHWLRDNGASNSMEWMNENISWF